MEVRSTLGNWEIYGRVIVGWEGDPSLPGGTRRLTSVEDLEVISADGADLLPQLTEEDVEECEYALIEELRRGE